MKNKKILILVPAKTARGGISNYYQVLKNEFSRRIEYFERGSRTWPYRKGFLAELLRAWKDYLAFRKRVAENDIGLIQTTTSLGFNTIIRDGLFIRYARKKKIKTIVFFRGWDDILVDKTEKWYLLFFKLFFLKADLLITLSHKSKNDLRRWGCCQEIRIETTLVDRKLLKNVDESFIIKKFSQMGNKVNLLFLSRVEIVKGIFELLEAYKILSNDSKIGCCLSLSICGDGKAIEEVNKWIKTERIKGVELKGFVAEDQKRDAFETAHIFLFPSFHGEGMPNAVLEAMGCGLPIVTTQVSGVVDFFVPGKNGYFILKNDSNDVVEKIKKLLQDKDGMCAMALNNYRYAEKVFRSDKVAQRMEKIFDQTMNG
jgi:glycosyltransferase involved in cell wall biosynthesis